MLDLAQTASSVVPNSTSPKANEASEQSKSTTESNLHDDGAAQCQVACMSRQEGKEPRRIALTSLSAKREHSGTLKEGGIKDSITNEEDAKQNSAHVNESVKNIDKPETTLSSLEVQDVACVLPKQKLTRRVEVITLLDDKPSTAQPCKPCTSRQQLFPGSSNADAEVETAAKSVAAELSAIGSKETSLEVDSPLPVVPQKSIMGAELVTAKNSGIAQANDSSNHSNVAHLQPSTNDVCLEKQSKGETSPPIKVPKRVGFVTLTANKPKQNNS